MNRKLRITFRNGDVRFIGGLGDKSLLEIVTIFRRDGWFMGDMWCAPCTDENVAMIEVVEAPADAARPEAPPGTTFGPIDRLAVVTGAGSFKPPGEA